MPYYSVLYPLPYIIVFGVLWFLFLNEKGRIKNGLSPQNAKWIAFFLMLIFLGLRGHVYSDFINYYAFFRNLPPIHKLGDIFQGSYEPGFVIYSSIIKTITSNYFAWVFINSFVDLFIFRLTFKRYTHSMILPFIFFMAYQGFIIEFNLYQNAKAIDLFLLSLPHLQKRKLLPYILLNLLGVSFHISAVIYLPLYFVLIKNFPRWFVWSMLISVNVIFLGKNYFTGDLISYFGKFLNEVLLERMIYYQNMEQEYIFSFGYFERTFSILICTILYFKLIEQNTVNRIFYNCAFFYYLSFMIFSDVRVFAERIPILFIFSYWILFSNIAVLKLKIRSVLLTILILISLLKVYTSSLNVLSYYDNLLWGIESYEARKTRAIMYHNK
jgi:hypothetical protein